MQLTFSLAHPPTHPLTLSLTHSVKQAWIRHEKSVIVSCLTRTMHSFNNENVHADDDDNDGGEEEEEEEDDDDSIKTIVMMMIIVTTMKVTSITTTTTTTTTTAAAAPRATMQYHACNKCINVIQAQMEYT